MIPGKTWVWQEHVLGRATGNEGHRRETNDRCRLGKSLSAATWHMYSLPTNQVIARGCSEECCHGSLPGPRGWGSGLLPARGAPAHGAPLCRWGKAPALGRQTLWANGPQQGAPLWGGTALSQAWVGVGSPGPTSASTGLQTSRAGLHRRGPPGTQ